MSKRKPENGIEYLWNQINKNSGGNFDKVSIYNTKFIDMKNLIKDNYLNEDVIHEGGAKGKKKKVRFKKKRR